jgi:hypothetical protein
MSQRVKDTPMGKSEKKKRKHLLLLIVSRAELWHKLDHGVSVRHCIGKYTVETTMIYDLKKQKTNC